MIEILNLLAIVGTYRRECNGTMHSKLAYNLLYSKFMSN